MPPGYHLEPEAAPPAESRLAYCIDERPSRLWESVLYGGVAIGALAETVIGASRLLGTLRRFLPPAVSGVVIVTIGLALGRVAVRLVFGDGQQPAASSSSWPPSCSCSTA